MLRRSIVGLLAALLAVLLAAPAVAQTGGEVEIVDVTALRYPRVQAVVEFRNVTELDPTQLEVLENGVPVDEFEVQTIAESTVPVGIVLVIDTSGSMEGEPLDAAKAAALQFINAKRDQDFIALVAFSDEPVVLSAFTNSRSILASRIEQLEAGGETALYDAVVRAAGMYTGEAANLLRNIVVLTDGNDTASTATLEDAVNAVREAQARVFAVALASSELNLEPLQALVTTPNDLYTTTDPAELASLYDQIRRELSNKLVIRFEASQEQAGPLEVGVRYQGLAATAVVEVPGFIRPGGGGEAGETTATTFAAPEIRRIVSDAPASASTLRLLAVIGTAVATVLLLFILFGSPKEDSAKAFRERLRRYGARMAPQAGEEVTGWRAKVPILRSFAARAERIAERRGVIGRINAALEQADIPLKPGEAIVAILGLSVLVGLFAFIYTGNAIVGIIGVVVALLAAAAAINYAGEREKRKFEDQLPDTLTLLATSLRAGLSLLQSIEAVANEAPSPTSREFTRAIAEIRLGRAPVDALRGIADRMQSEDFTWVVMAIEIQREVGGNLAEVLNTVADTMLQRNRLKRDVRALTAEGRISAIVLAAMPFLLFLFLFTSNRQYLEPLLTTFTGWLALGTGLGLMAIGAFWLRKIVDIEI